MAVSEAWGHGEVLRIQRQGGRLEVELEITGADATTKRSVWSGKDVLKPGSAIGGLGASWGRLPVEEVSAYTLRR